MNKDFLDQVENGFLLRYFLLSELRQEESHCFQFIRTLPMRSEVSLLIDKHSLIAEWASYESCYIKWDYRYCHSCKYYSDNEALNCAIQPVLADLIIQSKAYECPDFEIE